MKQLIRFCMRAFDSVSTLDFLPPLLMRLYLAPIFWMAGTTKLAGIDNTIAWFANPHWGLGLPFPAFLAYFVAITEVAGAVMLLFGMAVRWISIPLIAIMAVAALTVHMDNGWLAIAHHSTEASQRLHEFLVWLKSAHPTRHAFVTELGQPVVLNNGIEFAATYFIMLLSLFFTGAGKYLSIDHWVGRSLSPKTSA